MPTIAEQLTQLATIKSDIKQAIIDQGVSVSDSDAFSTYATKIGSIEGGGGATTVVPTCDSATILFYYIDKDGVFHNGEALNGYECTVNSLMFFVLEVEPFATLTHLERIASIAVGTKVFRSYIFIYKVVE